MDHKALKSDLTYAIKKLIKEGKIFSWDLFHYNLHRNTSITVSNETTRRVEAGDLVWEGSNFDAFEALVFVKGLQHVPEKEVSDWTSPDGIVHHFEWFLHEGFGLPLIDIVSEQGQIAKTDLYDFMDGLENVAGNDKSEFYKVGVYIREKFAPVGVRTETLQPARYKEVSNAETVRRFVVYNRPMPGCRKTGVPSVVEVECEVFTPIFAREGEFAARILKPEFLWEPTRILQNGVLKDVVLPPVYVSHSIYESLAQAREAAEQQVRGGFDFEVRKGRIASYTDEELKAKIDLIQEVRML